MKKWSVVYKYWVEVVDEFFSLFMGKDYLSYEFIEDLCCIVMEDGDERFEYDDICWENVCK